MNGRGLENCSVTVPITPHMGGRGVKLKYLHAFRDRTGTLRYYFRRNVFEPSFPACSVHASFLAPRPQPWASNPANPQSVRPRCPAHSVHWQRATLHHRNSSHYRQQVRSIIGGRLIASWSSTAIAGLIR